MTRGSCECSAMVAWIVWNDAHSILCLKSLRMVGHLED
jgi:hypothetical protein